MEGVCAFCEEGKHGGSGHGGDYPGRELNVSSDVSIASTHVNLSEMDRKEKALILRGKIGQKKLRQGAVQIFQSCTFNRSVTSPLMHALMGTGKRWDIMLF
jgi:hypothetical protein